MFRSTPGQIRADIIPTRHVVGRSVVLKRPILFRGFDLAQVDPAAPEISLGAGADNPHDTKSEKGTDDKRNDDRGSL